MSPGSPLVTLRRREICFAPPVLPGGGLDTVQRPDVIMPQFGAATTPALPGANPFQQQAVAAVVPTVTASTQALSGVNPFAPLPTVSPGAAVVPSAKPFSLSGPQPGDGTAEVPAQDATRTVDETALRYYAAERDLPRVGAETRRLKALHRNGSHQRTCSFQSAPSTSNRCGICSAVASMRRNATRSPRQRPPIRTGCRPRI